MKSKCKLTGVQGTTKAPLSKSIGGGEPLVIHVHMKNNPKDDDSMDTPEHEATESDIELKQEGEFPRKRKK